MGISLSGSFVLFIISIAIWAVKVVLYLMLLCRTLPGVILVPACMAPVVVIIFTKFYGSAPPARPHHVLISRPWRLGYRQITGDSDGRALRPARARALLGRRRCGPNGDHPLGHLPP